MTPREHDEYALPEVLVVTASVEDAAALAALRALDEIARPVLVATGPDPMAVDLALDDLEAPAGRVLLPEGGARGPADETAQLLPRFADALADAEEGRRTSGAPGVAAVVVRGGTAAALAATHAAVWAGVPVLALDAPPRSAAEAANRAAISAVTAWQTSEVGNADYPARLDLLVHRCLDDARRHRVVCMSVTGSPRTGMTA